MSSPLIQRFLSIFGLDQERKRVETEWDRAIERMRESTSNIKQERQHIVSLNETKARLLDGHRQLQIRMHQLTNGSLESLDGSGKAKNS